jgi:hypothetical protein
VSPDNIRRQRSLSTEERLLRLQQSLAQDLERLSPDTRRWVGREVARWHAEVSDGSQSPLDAMPATLAQVRAQDYVREPVGVRQFIEDPQFLGSMGKDFVYPRIVADLEELSKAIITKLFWLDLRGGANPEWLKWEWPTRSISSAA